MPQAIAQRSFISLKQLTPLQRLAPLKSWAPFLYLAGFLFSSITHADANEELAAKLTKLGYTEGETIERLANYRVDGWNYVDDRHIVLYVGPSKRFLITTMVDCHDLHGAENIGFTSTASYVTKFDRLIVRDAAGMVQHCPITELKTLNKTPKQ